MPAPVGHSLWHGEGKSVWDRKWFLAGRTSTWSPWLSSTFSWWQASGEWSPACTAALKYLFSLRAICRLRSSTAEWCMSVLWRNIQVMPHHDKRAKGARAEGISSWECLDQAHQSARNARTHSCLSFRPEHGQSPVQQRSSLQPSKLISCRGRNPHRMWLLETDTEDITWLPKQTATIFVAQLAPMTKLWSHATRLLIHGRSSYAE